ncbi:MAG TPA: Uma2 family endonuclease [Chthoniobacterales bacterium]
MQVLATYRFTTDEYHRLGEVGILNEDDRVELLNGDLVVREPVGGEHRTLVDSLNILFANRIGQDRYRIGVQNPISLDPCSEPQPDVVLYAPSVRGRHPRPDEIFLLVEVADISLAYDRGPKLEAYARSGVGEVWVIDVLRRRVSVYRSPVVGRYQFTLEAKGDDVLTVESFPDIIFSVNAILSN